MQVIEVAARFETTALAVVDLQAGATYRTGTGPGDDLAIDVDSVAIVEGDLVRVPLGSTAMVVEHGRRSPLTGELRLGARTAVEIRIGRVTITIRWVARTAPVPRPPVDLRPSIYVAASLVAQVLLVAVAARVTPEPERGGARTIRIARLPERSPATTQQPSPVPAVATAPADPSTAPPPAEKTPDRRGARRRAIAGAREAGILGSDGISDLRGLATSDVEKKFKGVRPVYREEEAVARAFGGGESWDPGGVVPVGRYATKPNAGADYELAGATPAAKTVVKSSCTTTGARTHESVGAVVDAHAEALLECHERYAGRNARGLVTIAFDIDRDGTVLRPTSSGMGELGGCAMRVMQSIAFPPAPGDAQTEVKLSLEFTK